MHRPIRVLHVSTFLSTPGGVEKLLRLHLQDDVNLGIESRAIILFEPQEAVASYGHATGLGLDGWSPLASAQARFRLCVNDWQPDLAIYHDGWGLPLFAADDRSQRRTLVLHCPSTDYRAIALQCRPLLDSLLTVSPIVANEWGRDPSLSEKTIGWLPLPVSSPMSQDVFHSAVMNRPLVICYCGRLERGCKRADRIPALLAELDQLNLDYRFNVLGTGPLEEDLRHSLRGHPRIEFHGHVTGPRYWEILSGCDAIVSFSDVEGMGMAVLDAMSLGVLPYYPQIGGGAEKYVESLGGGFLYPPGDLKSIAADLARLLSLSAPTIDQFRQSCRELLRLHTLENYRNSYAGFLSATLRQETKQSSSRLLFPPLPLRWLPFGILRRVAPSLLLRPWGFEPPLPAQHLPTPASHSE